MRFRQVAVAEVDYAEFSLNGGHGSNTPPSLARTRAAGQPVTTRLKRSVSTHADPIANGVSHCCTTKTPFSTVHCFPASSGRSSSTTWRKALR